MINIKNNQDLHYLIKKEFNRTKESLDIPIDIAAYYDFPFLGTLCRQHGFSIKNMDIEQSSILTLTEIDILNDTTVSSSKVFNFLNLIRNHYYKSISSIPVKEAILYFLTSWSNVTVVRINSIIELLDYHLNAVLGTESNSLFLLDTFYDDLITTKNINKELTTAIINLKEGYIEPGSIKRHKLSEEDVIQNVQSQNIILADYIDTRVYKDNNSISNPLLVSRRIYTGYKNDRVLITININAIDKLKKSKSLIIEMPVNNGIEQIHIVVRSKNIPSYEKKSYPFEGSKMILPLIEEQDELEELNLILESNQIDGFDDLGNFHLFLVSQITLLETSTANEYVKSKVVTKALSFNKGKSFKGLLLDINDGGYKYQVESIETKIQIYFKEKNYWTDFYSIYPGIPFHLGNEKIITNTKNRDDQLIVPFSFGSSKHFAALNYTLKNVIVENSMLPTKDGDILDILEPNNLTVLRGSGSRDLFIHPTIPQLSDDSLAGWTFLNNTYRTTLIFQGDVSKVIDFGPSSLTINGASVSGIYTFTKGIYNIIVEDSNWLIVNNNLNRTDFISQDSLFPFNHRYLIQGYKGVEEYEGVPFFGQQLCSYVDPDYLMTGLWKEDFNNSIFSTTSLYPAIYSIYVYEDNGHKYVKFLFPIDEYYHKFNNEKVIINGSTFSIQNRGSAFRLKFNIKSNILDSYSLRSL